MFRQIPSFIHRNSTQTAFAVFLLLTILLWISGLPGFQYQSLRNLAFETGFPGNAGSWNYRGPAENIVVTKSSITLRRETSGYSSARMLMDLPSEFPGEYKIRIVVEGILKQVNNPPSEATSKSSSISLNSNNANKVYLVLQAFDDQNNQLGVTHVGKIPNNSTRFTISRFYEPPEYTSEIALGLLLRHSLSQLTITSANVELVKQRSIYLVFSRILFVTILLTALCCGFILASRLNAIFLLIGAVLISVLLLLLTVPVKSQLIFINSYLAVIGYAIPTRNVNTNDWLANSSHFVIFFIAGYYIISLAMKISLPTRYCVAYLLLLAVSGEVLQLHLLERTMNFNDLIINIAGVALSFLLYRKLNSLVSN